MLLVRKVQVQVTPADAAAVDREIAGLPAESVILNVTCWDAPCDRCYVGAVTYAVPADLARPRHVESRVVERPALPGAMGIEGAR